MRLIRLLALGALAAYLYKRISMIGAGREETANAEPFSSDSITDDNLPVESGPAEPPPDPLKQPNWLSPADAG